MFVNLGPRLPRSKLLADGRRRNHADSFPLGLSIDPTSLPLAFCCPVKKRFSILIVF